MASGIKCVSCNQRINLPPQASGWVTCPMCKTSQAVPEQQGQNAPQLDNTSASRRKEPRPQSGLNPYSSPQVHPEVEPKFDTPEGRFPGWAVVGCFMLSLVVTFVLLLAILGLAIKFN